MDGVSLTKSSDLSNDFVDHFSSIEPELANGIPLSGPFQESVILSVDKDLLKILSKIVAVVDES